MRLAHFPHNKLNVRAASPRVRAAREGEGSEHQTRSGGMPCSSRASKRKRNMDTLHTRRFGRRLALGEADGTVQVRDAITDDILFTAHDHTNHVWALAWSPDGKRLASASWD